MENITILTMGKSGAGKLVDEFEASEISSALYKFLTAHWACRDLFQEIVRSGSSIPAEKAFASIKATIEKRDYKDSFVKMAKCNKCNIQKYVYELARFDFDKNRLPKSIKKCGHCNKPFEITELDEYWDIEPSMITSLFVYGSKLGIFNAEQHLFCPWCYKDDEYLTPNTAKIPRRYCNKCKNKQLLEMKLEFKLHKDIIKFTENKKGYWLEWYIWKYLSKKSHKNILHGRLWKIDGNEVETDIECPSISTVVLCDTKHEPTFNSVNFHLLSRQFKKIVLVTYRADAKGLQKIISAAKNSFSGNVEVIQGPQFDSQLPKLLRTRV